MGEILFWCFLLLTGVVLFIQTLGYQGVALMDPVMGPARFPQIAIVILLISTIGLLIIKLVKKEKKSFVFRELFCGIQFWFGSLILAYVLLLELLGFFLATSLFLIGSTSYLYYKEHQSNSFKQTVIRSMGIVMATVLIQQLFTRVMGVLLPLGSLFSN